MKNSLTVILLTTLASASTFAQSTYPSRKSSVQTLNYNRLGVSYANSGDADYVTVSTSASLGQYLVASANYVDVGGDISGFDLDGRLVTVGLGAKFNVGPGDINIGYRYGIGGLSLGGFLADVGEQDAFLLAYRQAVGSNFEFCVEVSRLTTSSLYPNDIEVTPITLSLRYKVEGFDVTAAFSTEDAYGLTDDENTLSLGVGYSF